MKGWFAYLVTFLVGSHSQHTVLFLPPSIYRCTAITQSYNSIL